MIAITLAVSLMAATPSPSPRATVSPQFMVGEWRSEEEGGTYHFRANGTYYWHSLDVGENGRWRLRNGNRLELVVGDSREIIAIDRVVHETIYVHKKHQKEIWLKQPGL